MLGSSKRKPSSRSLTEYVLFAFLVVVAVCGAYVAVVKFMGKNSPAGMRAGNATQKTAPLPVAPTADQYEAETRGVMSPFFEQAQKMTKADFKTDTTAMQQLVTLTQERILGVRVPKGYLDVHLSLVLLLDQWKRALAGSAADQKTVLQKTADIVAANPWLSAPSMPAAQ